MILDNVLFSYIKLKGILWPTTQCLLTCLYCYTLEAVSFCFIKSSTLFQSTLEKVISKKSFVYRHILKTSDWKWWWIPKDVQKLKQKLREVSFLLRFIQPPERSMLIDFPSHNSLTPCVTVNKNLSSFPSILFFSCCGLAWCTGISNAARKTLWYCKWPMAS